MERPSRAACARRRLRLSGGHRPITAGGVFPEAARPLSASPQWFAMFRQRVVRLRAIGSPRPLRAPLGSKP